MPKMSAMPEDVRLKVFELRCRAKSGGRLDERDQAFAAKAYERWPKDYAAMTEEVFEATKPFGATR